MKSHQNDGGLFRFHDVTDESLKSFIENLAWKAGARRSTDKIRQSYHRVKKILPLRSRFPVTAPVQTYRLTSLIVEQQQLVFVSRAHNLIVAPVGMWLPSYKAEMQFEIFYFRL